MGKNKARKAEKDAIVNKLEKATLETNLNEEEHLIEDDEVQLEAGRK